MPLFARTMPISCFHSRCHCVRQFRAIFLFCSLPGRRNTYLNIFSLSRISSLVIISESGYDSCICAVTTTIIFLYGFTHYSSRKFEYEVFERTSFSAFPCLNPCLLSIFQSFSIFYLFSGSSTIGGSPVHRLFSLHMCNCFSCNIIILYFMKSYCFHVEQLRRLFSTTPSSPNIGFFFSLSLSLSSRFLFPFFPLPSCSEFLIFFIPLITRSQIICG